MTDASNAPLVVHGWTLFAHPLFLDQVAELAEKVSALKAANPSGYRGKNATKRLAAINKLVFEEIPSDPAHPKFQQGNTLGDDHRHWFRAKFFQQYRLFFRYHGPSKTLVFAWVNDEETKRSYESSDDAYRVFRKMLENGHPPDDWDQLLSEAQAEGQRLQQIASQ